MYGLGVTDKVKGTGVWNSFELNRDKKEESDEDPEGTQPTKKKEEGQKK